MAPSSARLATALLAAGLLAAAPAAASAQEEPGRFLAISDVHLDPFTGGDADAELLTTAADGWQALYGGTPGNPSDYGNDSNVALLESALRDAAQRIPAPDFVVYPGDFVVHRLERKVRAVSADATDETVAAMAANLTLFLADRLRATFPDTPILPALGNTDSACGDYQTEPGGPYLAATFAMLRQLVGEELLAPDAEATWTAGGYYAARHPTVSDARFIVLNNILWSMKYKNRCGTGARAGDEEPGDAMLAWLGYQLYAAQLAGETVWLVYHIPAGVDAYSTAHAHSPDGATCASKAVPFWQERYRQAFDALMARHGSIVTTAFSGHIHRDSWRLFEDDGQAVTTYANIVPAISPIYGDAPAYQVFEYDRATGAILDKVTYAVTNLTEAAGGAPIAFAELYRFTKAYGLSPLDARALAQITAALRTAEPTGDRTLYARFFGSGHGDDPDKNWPVYSCTPGNAALGAFNACHCQAN